MQQSFNIPMPFFPFGQLRVSFKLYTKENVFFLNRDDVSVTKEAESQKSIVEGPLINNASSDIPYGRMRAEISVKANDYAVTLHAEHKEAIRALSVVIIGARGDSISTFDSIKEMPLRIHKYEERTLEYPKIFTPLTLLHNADNPNTHYYFRFEDLDFSVKRFIFRKDEMGTLMTEMLYEHASEQMDTQMQSPVFNFGKSKDAEKIVKTHASFLQYRGGVKERHEKKEARGWSDKIALIARLHCMHYTEKSFLDFERAAKAIDTIAKHTEKRTVLVKLSGWDGPYRKTLPRLAPAIELGGEAGLRALVSYAHQKKIFLALEVSVGLAHRSELAALNATEAIARDAFGNELSPSNIDATAIGNTQNPFVYVCLDNHTYLEHLKTRLQLLVSLGVDGFFFSDTFPIARGIGGAAPQILNELCADIYAMKEKLFLGAEHVFDKTSNRFAIAENGDMVGEYVAPTKTIRRAYPSRFYRYIRQTFHSARPADSGFCGVEADGFRKPYPRVSEKKIIPLLHVQNEDIEHDAYTKAILEEAFRFASSLL